MGWQHRRVPLRSPTNTDALGSSAYFDNLTNSLSAPAGTPVVGTSELIPGCHRSRADEAFIGGGVDGLDLACSGATTNTHTATTGINLGFKPGIDFYSSGPNIGQALALLEFGSTHAVKMVVLGIGGNDYGFSDILTTCLEDYLTSLNASFSYLQFYLKPQFPYFGWRTVVKDLRHYCSQDSSVTGNFSSANNASIQTQIEADIDDAAQALASEGCTRSDYTIVVQTYPDPVADSSQMRYSQGLGPVDKTRQFIDGCGFWDTDVNWMVGTTLPTINATVKAAALAASTQSVAGPGGVLYHPNVVVMDVTNAFQSHLLCESTDTILGLNSWTAPGAVDSAEWVNQVRTVSALLPGSPYSLQEDFHPNYWGQLAFRSCVRLAYNNGSPQGGTCTPVASGGLDGSTPPEPNMQF